MQRFSFILFLFLVLSAPIISARSHDKIHPETLRYEVFFKWGLINKKAGTVEIKLFRQPEMYVSKLTAQSEPWADRFYRVRDTLNSHMTLERTPILYEKIAHEGNDHKHDIVKYDISNPAAIKAACTRKVISKGKLKVEETRQLQADGAAIDMLSSFYYMRNLPFQDWNAGETHSIDIFSGKAKELLTFKYVGKERIKINDREYDTYHITFLFTSKGGTKSSDDMDAWISAEGQRIPLRLEGKLPVGRVKCFFVDENK